MQSVRTFALFALLGVMLGCSPANFLPRPDFTMQSVDLGGEHDRHPAETDSKYQGKTLAVTGHYLELRTLGEGRGEPPGTYLVLSHQVEARLTDSGKSAAARAQVGDTVTVQGVYVATTGDASKLKVWYLDNCYLLPTKK